LRNKIKNPAATIFLVLFIRATNKSKATTKGASTITKALFASFEGKERKGLGGEGKEREGREKGGKTFPLFGS
jgi:hypothetical protein